MAIYLISFIVLLICSNIFMNYAWYGHLKSSHQPLIKAILVSWGIAFFEYCLMIPANRVGYKILDVTELKVIQELISVGVFIAFSVLVFKQEVKWNHLIGFGFIILGVFFVIKKW